MQIKNQALFAAILWLGSQSTFANLQIFPAQGIYGLEQPCRSSIEHIEANASSIACDFSQAIANDGFRQQVNQTFEHHLQQSLPEQIVKHISQHNKHRTYVASLDVLRASEYIVFKDSTAEIFLPVTLSLKLTNVLSGEVIYTDSATLSQPIQVLTQDVNAIATRQAVKQKYQSSLITLTQQLSQDLAKKFKVNEISTQVLDRWKSYLILDKGFNQGIAKNDELSSANGDLIRVIHADSHYAVALPVLLSGSPTQFTKIASTTRQAVNKPKALVVDVLTYQGESKDLIEQVFSDAIGENASFSLTPVNQRFSGLLQGITEQTGLSSQEAIHQRELPEFFIRINIIPVISYQQKIGKMTEQQVVHSEVFAEMLDRSGRVIFSAHAMDEIKDIVSQGMGFSLQARKEVVLKNALMKLGQEFQKGIQFSRSDLKVSSGGNQEIIIQDPGERLTTGMKIHVYSRDKAAGREVLLPIWEATVMGREGSKAKAQLDVAVNGQERLAVRSGDTILIDALESGTDSKQARVLCPNLHTEQVGDIPFYGFGPVLYHAFTSESKRPFYATGSGFKGQTLLQDAIIRMTENAGFKKSLNLKLHIPQEECLQPAFRIEVKADSIQCNVDESQCDATLVMMGGVRRFNQKSERIGAYGLQQEIQLKGIDQRHRYPMYNIQMFKALPEIAKEIVKKADAAK